jgi:hypothetical protein
MPESFEGGTTLREIPWSSRLGVGRGADDLILQKSAVTEPHIEYVRRPEFYKNFSATE